MKLKALILLITVAVFAVISLLVFLTVPAARLSTGVFKLSFVFAIPLNLMIALGSLFYVFKKNKNTFARIPVGLIPVPVFTLVMLVTGLIFMYSGVERLVAPIIVFAVEIIIYLAVRAAMLFGAVYIEQAEKKVKKKNLYIKSLEIDVLDCAAMATNPDTAAALKLLAEDIRFSDPMSDKSLAKIEGHITDCVERISKKLSKNPEADITEHIKEAEALVKSRNQRCKLLK